MISPAKQRLTTLAKLFVSVLTYLSQTLMPKYSQYEHLQSPINFYIKLWTFASLSSYSDLDF